MNQIPDIQTRPTSNLKLWKIAFYVLGIFPALFIISLLTFYMHAGLINDYKSVSGIHPNEFPFYDAYAYTIGYGWIASVFSFLVWMILLLLHITQGKNKITWKPVGISLTLYLIALILTFSQIMEFAMD